MGLDTVELVIEVEEAFGVSIPDERASRILTVGDLYELLLEKTRDTTRNRDICLSAATFYEIRRAVNSHLGTNLRIRPDHGIAEMIPTNRRRRLWRDLARQLELRLPRLSRPAWLVRTCSARVAALCAWTALITYRAFGAEVAVISTLGVVALAGTVAAILTGPFATEPRSSIATFRGLSTNILALNYATLSARHNSWAPADVWNALRVIIVEQLGVRPEAVAIDADFIKDLGAE